MFKILVSITITAIVSVLATVYFAGTHFRAVIQERAEEDRLQSVALAQLLLERLDQGDTELLRAEVNSLMTASLAHADPENSYKHIYAAACEVHKVVYEYRATHSGEYISESPEEQMAQDVLQFWSKQDCDN